MILRRAFCFLAALAVAGGAIAKPPLVLAASSLQESLTAAGDAWAVGNHAATGVALAAATGGFVLGVAAFMLMKLLRRPSAAR